MKYNYRDFSEIPANIESYLLGVADIRSIGQISLEDAFLEFARCIDERRAGGV